MPAHRVKYPRSVSADFMDAVSLRTVVVIIGVLLIQLGFIASYVGAFHEPKPDRVPVAVVAAEPVPAQVRDQLLDTLNNLPDSPLDARAVDDAQTAQDQLRKLEVSGVFELNPAGTQDTLKVASAGGASLSQAVETVFTQVAAGQGRTFATEDMVPPQPGDGRGLTSFYLVIGWIVGGYLVAALLGVSKGSRPATGRRALFRMLAASLYALASGAGGAWVVSGLFESLTGHFWQLTAIGALVVFGAATVTMAFQTLFGVVGIGLTVIVFVVLGNPSAGGPYQGPLLPPFWRAIGPWLPNGAGTEAVRNTVYFNSVAVPGHLAVLAAWALAGVALTLLVATLKGRWRGEEPAGVEA